MPRKSVAALALANLTGPRPRSDRLVTPSDLSKAEMAIWRDTIETLPSDYFTAEQVHLVSQYCRCAARLAEIERALAKVRLRDVANYDRLARLSRQEGAACLRWARALRLTPQSRIKATVAGRRAEHSEPRINWSDGDADETTES